MNTQDRSRKILVHGLMLVMAGLVWGFLGAHPLPKARPRRPYTVGNQRPIVHHHGGIVDCVATPSRPEIRPGDGAGGLANVGDGVVRGRQCLVGNDPDVTDCRRPGWRNGRTGVA